MVYTMAASMDWNKAGWTGLPMVALRASKRAVQLADTSAAWMGTMRVVQLEMLQVEKLVDVMAKTSAAR